MKKILVCSFIIIFALVMVRFTTVKKQESDRAKTLAANTVPVVKLGTIGESNVVKPFEIPGRIESSDKVDLIARIDGYLQKKHFKEGDFVRKGQVLLTIEPTQYLNILNKALADIKSGYSVRVEYKEEKVEKSVEDILREKFGNDINFK